jgi:ADP-dependent NAD(P)H-hydrate dehydratase / NAD(P)H-hydrate epimerase
MTRSPTARPQEPPADELLPGDDPAIFELDLAGLARRWSASMQATPMTAEAMMGADRRAQRQGVPEQRLMEHAGSAVAAAVRALAADQGRRGTGPILVLCGPGNNGGDGFVAARRLARLGAQVIVVFVASENRPRGRSSAPNWDRLEGEASVTRVHAAVARDVAIVAQGVERAAVVVDALLGTGVRGVLRDPIRAAVEMAIRARGAGIPVVSVDTPTAVDLTSGEASDPVVRADLTVTFHRPKTGLRARRGAALAGRVLVAPIGIPAEADVG